MKLMASHGRSLSSTQLRISVQTGFLKVCDIAVVLKWIDAFVFSTRVPSAICSTATRSAYCFTQLPPKDGPFSMAQISLKATFMPGQPRKWDTGNRRAGLTTASASGKLLLHSVMVGDDHSPSPGSGQGFLHGGDARATVSHQVAAISANSQDGPGGTGSVALIPSGRGYNTDTPLPRERRYWIRMAVAVTSTS